MLGAVGGVVIEQVGDMDMEEVKDDVEDFWIVDVFTRPCK